MNKPLRFVWFCGFLVAAAGSLSSAQQAPPTGLYGQVTSASVPVAGLTIQAFRPGESTPAASTTTGTDGRYQITTLVRGVYRIEFSLSGYEKVTRMGIVVLGDAPERLNVVLNRVAAAPASPAQSGSLRPGELAVTLETSLGSIVLAIDTEHAPVTSANFLKYVDGGFYNGGRFHRATRPDNYTPAPPNRPMMEIIQGGINPERRDAAFPAIPLERTSMTGLKHVRGTVSMARGSAADTATSDIFILLDDQPSLDFGGRRFDDGQGGAAFGRVLSGMDVVQKIQRQPVQGQNLTPPVPIISASRVK